MKPTNLLLLGGVGLAIWYYGGLAKAAALAQVVFTGLTINSITDWTATFTVQNVTNAQIIFYSMAGNLLVNGNQLANISLFPAQPITIAANSQGNINVSVKPSLLSIPGDILQAIQAGSTQIAFEAKGAANINNINVPFDMPEVITV